MNWCSHRLLMVVSCVWYVDRLWIQTSYPSLWMPSTAAKARGKNHCITWPCMTLNIRVGFNTGARSKLFHAVAKAQYTPPTPMRRNCLVASRRRLRCVHEFATTADGFERTTQPSAASLQLWSRLPTGVFTPTTRRNCRQLVANSCTQRRRDETRQFRLVGSVYWA